MIIFLRNIADKTKYSDIISFVEPAIKKIWFRRQAEIIDVKIMQLHDPQTGESEFHGIVTIEPDKAGQTAIRKLNRKKFLNKHIAVHEYHRRNWHNDPRLKRMLRGHERRLGDRRRKDLSVVKEVTNKISGYKEFSQRYE